MSEQRESVGVTIGDRVAVAAFILLLLGASLLVVLLELTDVMAAYVVVVGVVYALITVGLLWRVLNAG